MRNLERSIKTGFILVALSLSLFSYSSLSVETAYGAEAQTSGEIAEALEMFRLRQELNTHLIQMVKE